MPATSSTHKSWRWNTHFEHFKVSPKKTRYRNKITVSGTLVRYFTMKKKGGFKHRKVHIYFTCKSDKKQTWYNNSGSVTTDSKGRFHKRVHAYCTGKFFAWFDGASDTFAGISSKVSIKVSGTPHGRVAYFPLTSVTPPPFFAAPGEGPARAG